MNEKRANDLLDLVEQARTEGDKETEAKAIKAYKMEFGDLSEQPSGVDTLGNKAMRYGKEAVRQFGITGKNIAEGVVGVPGLITDTPAMIYEALSGKQAPYWTKPAQSFVQGMEQLGGKELAPANATERIVGDITRAAGGAGGGLGAGQMMTRAASPMLQSAGQILSSLKGAFAPAITSSLASGITREAGGGPGSQLAAALAGGLAPTAGAGALKLMSGVKPSAEAQLLLQKGFDLTPGQLKKGGILDQLETAFENVPIIGQIIRSPKDQVEKDLRHRLIQESAAPGAVIPKSEEASHMLNDAYDSFDTAYSTVHGFPLVLQNGKPVIVNVGKNLPLDKALQSAVYDVSVRATNETRASTASWLKNLLTRPIKNSEDLLDIRSQIRSDIRNNKGTDKESIAERALLEKAESVVTKALESQLPPKLMQDLNAVDAKYANFKALESAVFKGGERFTPAQVETALKQGADKGSYARGGGSPLRPLVEAGKAVTAQTLPQTGARLGPLLAAAGVIGKGAAAIPAALMGAGLVGTKTGRTLARGGYDWQNAAAARPLDYRAVQGLLEAEKARRMANLLAAQEQ
jgi:hypothetical protein